MIFSRVVFCCVGQLDLGNLGVVSIGLLMKLLLTSLLLRHTYIYLSIKTFMMAATSSCHSQSASLRRAVRPGKLSYHTVIYLPAGRSLQFPPVYPYRACSISPCVHPTQMIYPVPLKTPPTLLGKIAVLPISRTTGG
ncbi:hypothetical protein P167DRAFT_55511 [Morchella conica CCBAS932]|uniref:Uncharacterized protein n=1 Tax=Morchella conica CCBAS932 TaxID=1392247 RepID=A0A3N4L1R1_9PEZI|nr:hypothetical protein P167DRAFT_55511 [Morchella conica CCBAS932]